MSALLHHLPVLPIVLPLISGALLLFLPQTRTVLRSSIALLSTLAQVAIAAYLLYRLIYPQPGLLEHGVEVYVLGGWVAPYGIVLVVDRLSALMLALNAAIALPVHVYSLAGWDRVGVQYHSLLQFLLMGLNGAFLTGDLFNLFVFFEILLSASYGLLLHGSNSVRVKAGLHYVAVNLMGSLIFLIGVALIYGVAGTLNMADLGVQWAAMAPDDRSLFEAGVGILGIAFLIKAGIWPLNFWLPTTYTAASPPVAAMFAIMTKVGVYALLRMGSLLAIPEAPAPFAGPWLFYGTVATMWFGIVGMLAAKQLTRLVAFSVIVSSGTLARGHCARRDVGDRAGAVVSDRVGARGDGVLPDRRHDRATARQRSRRDAWRRSRRHTPLSCRAIRMRWATTSSTKSASRFPRRWRFSGMAFVSCAILTTGLPPLVGFIAKFSMISALLGAAMDQSSMDAWLLIVSLLAAGFAGLFAFTKRGMRSFWSTGRHDAATAFHRSHAGRVPDPAVRDDDDPGGRR